MQYFSPKIINLINALKELPGVGTKTAQRMAFYLLDKKPEAALNISETISDAINNIRRCDMCQSLTDESLCIICKNTKRDNSQLCIVENMLDLFAIESSDVFKGKYFVLHGRISPLDGIGPDNLRLDLLEDLLKLNEISEVVIALGSSIEGEATVFYLSEIMQKYKIKVSRIGFGVPVGGELEYLDQQTLFHAFNTRKDLI